MIQNEAQVQAIETMEKLIGREDWAGAAYYFTPDVTYKVAARETVHGVAGIRAYMAWQNQLVRWQGHTIHLIMNDSDVVIVEVDSHFLRVANDTRFTLPCTDIYRMEGLKIKDWRVYADISLFNLT